MSLLSTLTRMNYEPDSARGSRGRARPPGSLRGRNRDLHQGLCDFNVNTSPLSFDFGLGLDN